MEKENDNERVINIENEGESLKQEIQLLRNKLLAVERKLEGAAKYISFLENFLYRIVRDLVFHKQLHISQESN